MCLYTLSCLDAIAFSNCDKILKNKISRVKYIEYKYYKLY